ncbi:MAG: hypothetical protein ACJ74H_05930 [Thermoanaerobaculia bacterium]
MTTKKKKKTRKGLPDPASIVEEQVFPSGYRILRTTEVDEYEEKRKKPAKKK